MKRIMALLVLLSLFTLTACTKEVEVPVEKIVYQDKIIEVEAEPIEIPEEVNMNNIDLFLERENVQLVDLRNYSDKMASGYIQGFEIISFFEYLEKQAIVRNNGWTWQEDNMIDGDILRNYFDQDADAIFLMCGSGTRAGFVKSALEQLGYTNVYNVGGIADYSGMYKVLGGLEANKLKFEAEVFTYPHWTPARDLTSPAYITFKAELLGFTRYQVVYTSCTWRASHENYKQVAYVELSTDGTVRAISFDTDLNRMTPAVWGDSNPPRNIDDLSKPGVESLDYFLETFVEGYLIGKTAEELAALNTMADADFAEFDSFAGSSVSMNNLLRVIQGLQDYHLG